MAQFLVLMCYRPHKHSSSAAVTVARHKKRTLLIVLLCLLAIVAGIYCYIRFSVLKAKDYKPDPAKGTTALDLRPAIIAKLQQLVKDGSDSLYQLSIGSLDFDITASTIDVHDVKLMIDSAGEGRQRRQKKLPDDLAEIHLAELHIDGLGADELLHKRDISVKAISFKAPAIDVFHEPQDFNRNRPPANESLYSRLKKYADRISIGKIEVLNGTFTDHTVHKSKPVVTSRVANVSVQMTDLLIDSATEHEASRFLFAKHAAMEFKDYSFATSDSLYLFKAGKLSITAETRSVVVQNLSFLPRVSKEGFQQRQKTQGEMYRITIPRVTFSGINWWKMLHREEIIGDEAAIEGGELYIYLDKRLPSGGHIKPDNFPQQMLADAGVPIAVKRMKVSGLTLTYEEMNSSSGEDATISFNNITGQVSNALNISDSIKRNPTALFSGKCMFMNHTPLSGTFNFALAKARRGAFSADVRMGALDAATVNAFAPAMGMVRVKSGAMTNGAAHIAGDNYRISGSVAAQYADLRIEVLKKTKDGDGNLKKKKLTDAFANIFLVKNDNPRGKGQLRVPDFVLERTDQGNFFNFAWLGIKKGLLITIGVPPRLGM